MDMFKITDFLMILAWASPFKALNYSLMEIKGIFQFEIIINVLALSASFEYLCYGSTAIRNTVTLTARGSTLDVRI